MYEQTPVRYHSSHYTAFWWVSVNATIFFDNSTVQIGDRNEISAAKPQTIGDVCLKLGDADWCLTSGIHPNISHEKVIKTKVNQLLVDNWLQVPSYSNDGDFQTCHR